MIGRLLALRTSMLAQMALLTIVFLGWGIYSFVVRPVLDIPVSAPPPANEATAMRVQEAIRAFMIAERDGPRPPAPLADDPVIRAVQARNPGFRYHVRVGDRAFGNGAAVYFRALHLDRVEQVHRALPSLGICSMTSRVIKPAGGTGYVDFYMCDTLSYFEYRGLVHPVIANSADLTPLYEKWFWAFSNNFLVAALGLFVIFAIIMGVHMVSIRRVARLAGSFDPEQLNRTLPEKGLATEVLPLVRAVNHMLGQVDEAQRRNRFFLSAAAHEMRTPLTVLRTRLELMDGGAMKDKLIGDVRRLIVLVNQLLALMSIGNRREVSDPVDLVACCRKAVAGAASAADAGVTVEFEAHVPACEILGDAALIRSAVSNLIENAAGVSPQGGRVLVAVDTDARVSVRDFGPGLSQTDPAALFEPFVRFGATRSGYGLGLAIVKAVATLHGATVTATDADGGGACFAIAFPLPPAEP